MFLLGVAVVVHVSSPRSLKPSRLHRSWSNVCECPRRIRRWGAIGVVVAVSPVAAHAQEADTVPQLGLGASSAIALHAGATWLKHASLGTTVGGALDLGWVGRRTVRLSVGVDYVAMTIDRSDSLGTRERGKGYVFTTLADVTYFPWLARRLSPYAGVGFGVDAIGTQISNEQIGAIYNANVFNLHAQLGALYRLTSRGRLTIEARGTGARIVRRAGVTVGYSWFYNQLTPDRE